MGIQEQIERACAQRVPHEPHGLIGVRAIAAVDDQGLLVRSTPRNRMLLADSQPRSKTETPGGNSCVLYAQKIKPKARCALFRGAQLATQDLSDVGLGQVVPKLDVLRHFVAGQVLPAVLATSSSVSVGSFLTTNTLIASPCFSSGTPMAAHSTTPGHREMTFSSSFGKHVEPADQDHVLLAIDDLGVAALVHDADVAGAHEAVGRERLRVLFRLVVVARASRSGPLMQISPGFAQRQDCARRRP